ncbi:MAG: hypothetical protein ACREDR_00795 [Blastocatellia bacterium]
MGTYLAVGQLTKENRPTRRGLNGDREWRQDRKNTPKTKGGGIMMGDLTFIAEAMDSEAWRTPGPEPDSLRETFELCLIRLDEPLKATPSAVSTQLFADDKLSEAGIHVTTPVEPYIPNAPEILNRDPQPRPSTATLNRDPQPRPSTAMLNDDNVGDRKEG